MGKYSLCSNNASLMGMMLDSIESVIKKKKILKVITGRLFLLHIPKPAMAIRIMNAKGVNPSKNLVLKGYR